MEVDEALKRPKLRTVDQVLLWSRWHPPYEENRNDHMYPIPDRAKPEPVFLVMVAWVRALVEGCHPKMEPERNAEDSVR